METADVTPKKKSRKWAWWALGIIAVLAIIGSLSEDNPPGTQKNVGNSVAIPSGSNEPPSTRNPEVSEPPLELQSWHWGESYTYAIAEGQVKNISSSRIENVEAVVTWETKDGEFITSSEALITYNPILPGQISPFKVAVPYNPSMKSANIAFKQLMGGTLEFRKRAKK